MEDVVVHKWRLKNEIYNIWVYDAWKIICDVMRPSKKYLFQLTRCSHHLADLLAHFFFIIFFFFFIFSSVNSLCWSRDKDNRNDEANTHTHTKWVFPWVSHCFGLLLWWMFCCCLRRTGTEQNWKVAESGWERTEQRERGKNKNNWQKKNKHMYHIIMCWRHTCGWRKATARCRLRPRHDTEANGMPSKAYKFIWIIIWKFEFLNISFRFEYVMCSVFAWGRNSFARLRWTKRGFPCRVAWLAMPPPRSFYSRHDTEFVGNRQKYLYTLLHAIISMLTCVFINSIGIGFSDCVHVRLRLFFVLFLRNFWLFDFCVTNEQWAHQKWSTSFRATFPSNSNIFWFANKMAVHRWYLPMRTILNLISLFLFYQHRQLNLCEQFSILCALLSWCMNSSITPFPFAWIESTFIQRCIATIVHCFDVISILIILIISARVCGSCGFTLVVRYRSDGLDGQRCKVSFGVFMNCRTQSFNLI